MIFYLLRTLSLFFYMMTGYTKRDPAQMRRAEIPVIGASSTAIFLYGVSLLYGLSGGQTELSAIANGMPTAILVNP
jgi:NAD(P)H-quinone oxidoreductase subunit 2